MNISYENVDSVKYDRVENYESVDIFHNSYTD